MSGRRTCSLALGALFLLASVTAFATSHVRIVRLSYVDGKVQMEKVSGQGLEHAILNAPIVEGTRILTGSNGLAEVEFEDNSTVRLGEATEVRFSQLLINDAGDKVNEVELVRGTMYFDARSDKHDIDRVLAAGRTVVVRHDSQIRFMMLGDQAQIAVLSGEAEMESNAQIARLKKNDTVTVDSTNPAGSVMAKGVENLPLDKWNDERASYQGAYSYNNNGLGTKSMSGSGYSDLAYYGSFMSVPGYGMAWQPYGAASWAGWDPYMSGAWAYAPGMGYSWASAYPWGWMPYHYGAWAYTAGTGWFWFPGSSLNNGGVVTNWQATAPVVKGPAGYSAPTAPVVSSTGSSPAILVGRIGTAPAYLPGGPVPPNFRSVITDHSGLVGTNSASPAIGGRTGTSSFATNSARAAAASRAVTTPSGHVFIQPSAPSGLSEGYGSSGFSGGRGTTAQTSSTPVAHHSTHGAGAPK